MEYRVREISHQDINHGDNHNGGKRGVSLPLFDGNIVNHVLSEQDAHEQYSAAINQSCIEFAE